MPQCPKCGANMVPLRGKLTGRGWGCSLNRWDPRTKRATGCDGIVWNKSSFQKRERTPRASDWPGRLSRFKRTAEQEEIRRVLSLAPDARGSRMVICNAVAGSAKSWSMADSGEVIYQREGASRLQDWWQVAFNLNARDSLEGKLPALWPNVATINSFGGRLQGYTFRQYKSGKVTTIFREMVKGLPRDERPNPGPLKSFTERAQDMLIYTEDSGDKSYWQQAIASLSMRFPGLGKRLEKEDAAEVVREYLPLVMYEAQRDGSVISIGEQCSRPATTAIRSSGWRVRWEWFNRGHEWTDSDISHLATLIRAVRLPQVRGVIVDEAQDLSLSQVVLFMAATWRSGELVLVGDDVHGCPGEPDYKSGQGIFGWRGAGILKLSVIPRLWQELTGERPVEVGLSETFRIGPAGVAFLEPFCPRMRTSRPEGCDEVQTSVPAENAYDAWLNLPENETALWLFRRNAPIGPIFRATLKDRKRVCLRGGGDFTGKVDGALFDACNAVSEGNGWYDDAGEYKVNLTDCIRQLRLQGMEDDSSSATTGEDSLASLLADLGQAILDDASILREANDGEGNALKTVASVGNLRRFVTYFASINAPRVLSTVYRSKGDEADLVIVDDCEALNEPWNGDERERDAVAFVACSRQKRLLLVCGEIDPPCFSGHGEPQDSAGEQESSEPATEPTPSPKSASKPQSPRKSQAADNAEWHAARQEMERTYAREDSGALKPLDLFGGEVEPSKPKRTRKPRK